MTTPLARWKDLCLDAVDQSALGGFWASALDRGVETSPGKLSLEGRADHERIWVNAVERPHTVKNRVHLDVHALSVAHLQGLGASVLAHEAETGLDWTVMADPEGGEFCAFVSERRPRRGLYAVVVDCVDAAAQARWWAAALGREMDSSYAPEAYGVLHPTPDPDVGLVFVSVTEPRVGPNRVHWDTYGDAGALLDAGATQLWETEHWTALADPEGNEFCAFPPGLGPSRAG